MWKIVEKLVPNLNTPITWKLSERQGRLCDVLSVEPGAVDTKCYHSFKWHAIRLFNSLPQHLRNLTICLKIDLTSTYLLYLLIQLLPTMTTA